MSRAGIISFAPECLSDASHTVHLLLPDICVGEGEVNGPEEVRQND